jgi:hypothetical protein
MFVINFVFATVFSLFLTFAKSEVVGSEFTDLKHDLSAYILPPVFGDFNLSSLSTTATCGASMASYSSVAAYSNGNYQGTGFIIFLF